MIVRQQATYLQNAQLALVGGGFDWQGPSAWAVAIHLGQLPALDSPRHTDRWHQELQKRQTLGEGKRFKAVRFSLSLGAGELTDVIDMLLLMSFRHWGESERENFSYSILKNDKSFQITWKICRELLARARCKLVWQVGVHDSTKKLKKNVWKVRRRSVAGSANIFVITKYFVEISCKLLVLCCLNNFSEF